MKNIKFILSLIFVGLILLASCENEPLEGEFLVTPDIDIVDSQELLDETEDAEDGTDGMDTDDDNEGNGDEAGNFLFADIDGVDLMAQSTIGLLVSLGGQETINIVSNNNTNQSNITIGVPANITPGEYTFDLIPVSSDSIIGQYIPDITDAGVTFSASSDGTLVITMNDSASGRIEGTFEFTGRFILPTNDDMFDITNGSFGVNY